MKKLFIVILFLVSCTSSQRFEKLTISGSDTMYQLMEILSAVYMKKHPETSIYVSGGGTEYGFHAIENGKADICMASRNLNSNELKIIAEKFQSIGVSHLIAKDAISIYINIGNNESTISAKDLFNIYTCRIQNWSELGGYNTSIIPIRRASTSGTYHYFKEHILNGESYCETINSVSTQDEMIEFVENNKYAIGYGGVGNHGNTKLLKVDGYEPSQENIKNDKYPLTRYLQLITISEPKGKSREFINWILSPDGQKIVRNFGYVPLY